jgi:hypothetical protein
MAFFQKPGKVVEMPDGCPYDPDLKTYVMNRVAIAIEEHQKVGARDSWALWDDEMGVYAKEHIARCERCRDVFLKTWVKNLGKRLFLTMSGFPVAPRQRVARLLPVRALPQFLIIPGMPCGIITPTG